MRITNEMINEFIRLFEVDKWSCNMIAKKYGMSRTGVVKCLNRFGIDTRKRKIDVVCSNCGKTFKTTRAYYRKMNNHFCCQQCYIDYIRNHSNYIPNRYGQKLARNVVVKECPELEDINGWVVHHKDGNNLNNNVNNLVVFDSQSSHMKYHRFGNVNDDQILFGSLD